MAFAQFNPCEPCCTKCQLVVGTIHCGSTYEVDITVRAGPTVGSKVIAATSIIANNLTTILNFDASDRNSLGNLVTMDTRGQFAPSTQSSVVHLNAVPCTGTKIFDLQTGVCCGPCRTPPDSGVMVVWNDPTFAALLPEGITYNYPMVCIEEPGAVETGFTAKQGPIWTGNTPTVGAFGSPCFVSIGNRQEYTDVVSSINIPLETPFFLYRVRQYTYGCCGGHTCFGLCNYPFETLVTDLDFYGCFRLGCASNPLIQFPLVGVTHGTPAPPPADFSLAQNLYNISISSFNCVPFMFFGSIVRTGGALVDFDSSGKPFPDPFVSGVVTVAAIGI